MASSPVVPSRHRTDQARPPQGMSKRGWRDLRGLARGKGVRELILVLVVTLAYFLSRGLVRGRQADAVQHAYQVLGVERALHLNPEQSLQHLALQHMWLLQSANAFYVMGHLPILISIALWLYWSHPIAYHRFRNAFLVSALLGLCAYVVYPVAPPRFLPGFVDTERMAGFDVDGSVAGPFYNPYAAMPSLHVGWSLLMGIALMSCGRSWRLRAVGAMLPILMTTATVMTGNHYVLDAAAGMVVVLVALMATTRSSSPEKISPSYRPLGVDLP